ncbi:putative RNA polymerase sigma factor, region 2, protein DA1 [Helianthus annuus]|nr:putative RNA polymerase sigma factor, region 2, protein DA1 [Helianthus annuus]
MECTLAREKLTLSNIPLVMSVAQKYKHIGADMYDLIQGVTRTFFENSKTLRLPTHLHERLSTIRSAKAKLERKGITPSIDRIAETLPEYVKKEICKLFSLDKEAFLSLNGIPGDTLHSIPTNTAWLIEYRAHPFWAQKYCPSHEHDGTPRCCSSERMEVIKYIIIYIVFYIKYRIYLKIKLDIIMITDDFQPRETSYAALNDGRKLCLECLDSSVMDTSECQPLYYDIQAFYESLNMRVEQKILLLLVERQALNEAMDGGRNSTKNL